MPPSQAAGWVLILASFVTSCGSLGEKRYRSGIAAYGKGDLKSAIHALWMFVATDCHYPRLGDPRCHEAELDLARAFRRSQYPAWALLIYDKMELWQSAEEVMALRAETDEARAALDAMLARSPVTVPAEIRFRHDAPNSFEIMYALLYLDGKKVFDSRQHAVPVDLTAGWVSLFSGNLPDGEHVVVFKIASVSRPAKATPSPMLWTRSRVVGGRGRPILLDLISFMKPGTLTDYGSMQVAVGIHTPISPVDQEAEELDDPMVVPED